jgi:hypothetical protein
VGCWSHVFQRRGKRREKWRRGEERGRGKREVKEEKTKEDGRAAHHTYTARHDMLLCKALLEVANV